MAKLITMPVSLACLAIALLLAAAGAVPPDASAAVRICRDAISSDPVTGTTEAHARRAALSAWIKKAKKLGEGYTAWRLATPRAIKCLAQPDKGFACVAIAKPCTIKQKVPPVGPDGRPRREQST